jgi:hypothetical protein
VHLELLNMLLRADRARHDQLDRPRCLDGTRTRVLKGIEDWINRDDERRVYWLNGAAGTGKTTIALTIADTVAMDENKLLASFFCSRVSADRSDVNLIFPSIARILADRDTQFRAQLIKAIQQNETIGSARLGDQLKQLIVEPLRKMGPRPGYRQRPTLIVLDALDECAADRAPEHILAALASQLESVPFLKVFVSSRPTSSTEDAFADEALQRLQRVFYLHDVRRDDIDVDIRKYLFDRLREAGKRRKLTTPNWPPVELVENLVEKAEGLFIFASTVCEYVEGDGGPEHLLRKITGHPIKGLDALYREVLQNASSRFPYSEDVEEWLHIIGTIILLRTQLSLNDIGPLLKLNPDHVRGRLRNVQSVLIVPEDPGLVIRTLHASFYDFLIERLRSDSFFIDPAIYHEHVMLHCLNFIITHQKGGDHSSTLTYASQNWLHHLDCVLINWGKNNLCCFGELMEYVQNLRSQSFHCWMKALIVDMNAKKTIWDLFSVVDKLKVSPIPLPCLKIQTFLLCSHLQLLPDLLDSLAPILSSLPELMLVS